MTDDIERRLRDAYAASADQRMTGNLAATFTDFIKAASERRGDMTMIIMPQGYVFCDEQPEEKIDNDLPAGGAP